MQRKNPLSQFKKNCLSSTSSVTRSQFLLSIVDIFAVGEGSADYLQDVRRNRADLIFHQDHPPLSNLFRAAYSNIPYYNNIVLNKYNINYLSNRGSGQKVL